MARYLSELLDDITYTATALNGETITSDALQGIEVTALVADNRKLSPGCVFVCIKGMKHDGHDDIRQAIEAGDAAIVTEREPDTDITASAVIIRVDSTRYAYAFLSAAWFDHPARHLTTIGITGTKGKTTTTYLMRSMLESAGRRVGLIGTIEVIIGDEHIHAENTTPESYQLQEYMRRMVDAGLDTLVMEVSSQALMLHRCQGFIYDIGIFTNIEPDHIGPGEHTDFDDYLHCKSLLMRQCRMGIVNGDDRHIDDILEGHTCEVTSYGFSEGADLRAVNLAYIHKPGELGVLFDTEGAIELHAEVPTPGRFSVYNALCAIAVAHHLGVGREDIISSLKNAHVKGRIEMIPVSDEFTLMIDYAHNAMALKSLLTTLRDYHPGRLVCLFGCGGNRSRDRRFDMGEISGRLADLTIITSDNPRFEEPMDIIADIVTGMERTDGAYVTIPDRKDAIRYAIEGGEKGDIIVLAGKGHEDYQEIRGVKHPMDERDLIRDILAEGTVPGSGAPADIEVHGGAGGSIA